MIFPARNYSSGDSLSSRWRRRDTERCCFAKKHRAEPSLDSRLGPSTHALGLQDGSETGGFASSGPGLARGPQPQYSPGVQAPRRPLGAAYKGGGRPPTQAAQGEWRRSEAEPSLDGRLGPSALALGLQYVTETGSFGDSRPSALALGLQYVTETGSFGDSRPSARALARQNRVLVTAQAREVGGLGPQDGSETGSFATRMEDGGTAKSPPAAPGEWPSDTNGCDRKYRVRSLD